MWSALSTCVIANTSTATLLCPLPFTYQPSAQRCARKCPPNGIDDPDPNDKVWIITKVFGSTSIVLEALILLPVWHQTKKGQLNCMLHFWIANLIVSIGNVIPRWRSWKWAMCSDDWTLRTASSTTCFATAFANIFAETAVGYWLMFAMYSLLIRQPTYRRFALSSYLDGEAYPWLTERSVLLCIGWGIPFAEFLIGLCSGWLDSSAGPFACSVNPTYHNGWALNGLVYMPLTIVQAISTIIILAVMFLVIKHGVGAIKTQWRILAVGAYYICVVWIVVGYAWHAYAVRDQVAKAVEAAIGASIASGGAVSYLDVLREKNPLNPNFNVAVVALVSSIGTVLGLLFLITPGHWRYYKHVVTSGRLSWSETEGSGSPLTSSRRASSSRNSL